MDDRHTGEQLRAMAQHEVERLLRHGDDDVGRWLRVLVMQVGRNGVFVVVAAELGIVQELVKMRTGRAVNPDSRFAGRVRCQR